MDLVLDANILFAALIRNSHTRHLLILSPHNFYVPEYIIEEIRKYAGLLGKKTGLSKDKLNNLLNTIIEIADITIIPSKECKKYLQKAKKISPDPKDVPYFALAMNLKCAIWSNDKKLKEQNEIRIYNTEEITNHNF